MAKRIIEVITLNIMAGKAYASELKDSPLTDYHIDIDDFCSKYNSATKKDAGSVVPVKVFVYEDNSVGFALSDPVTVEELFNEEETKIAPDNPNETDTASTSGYSGGGSGFRRKKETKPQQAAEQPVSVNYNSVLASVNDIAKNINQTSFANDSSYQPQGSNAAIFNSINSGDSYFKGISSNLLSQITIGTENVGALLTNYSQQDAKLATLASGLTSGQKEGLFGSLSATYESDAVKSFQSITSLNANLFNDNIEKGKVGKISLNDLNGAISKVTATLDNEIQDASKLGTSLSNLYSSPDIQGQGWDSFKNILSKYIDCNDTRSKAAQKLKEAYLSSQKIINDYIVGAADTISALSGTDYSSYATLNELDDSKLPEIVSAISDITENIKSLTDTINSMKAAKEEAYDIVYDDDGKPHKTNVRLVPKYTAAEIAPYEAKLEEAKVLKGKLEAYKGVLEGFADVVSQAQKVLSDAITDIEYMYAKDVFGVDTPRLKEARENGYDFGTTAKEIDVTNMDNEALKKYIQDYGVGNTTTLYYRNAKGEKVKIGVTLFSPNDTIGVGYTDGSDIKASTVFKNFDADVVMNCALNSAPIIVDGKVVKNCGSDFFGKENVGHPDMEILCQKQDGTFVVVPTMTEDDPKGKNLVSRLKEGYINENGERENYKFAVGGYYNIVDSNGNYIHRDDGYLNKNHPRSMVLQTKDGYTYLIACEGRTGGTNGMTLKDMYNFATEKLCDKDDISIYYNGDGGSSTSYRYYDEKGNIVNLRSSGKTGRRTYIYGISNGGQEPSESV